MTPNDLVTITQQHTGNRSGPDLTTAWWLARVNEGYRDIATYQGFVARPGSPQPQFRQLRFEELEDRLSRTLSGLTSNFIANQSGVHALLGLWDRTNEREVRRRGKRQLMRRNPADTGDLMIWCPGAEDGATGYYVWKYPTSDVQVYEYVYNLPETLETDGDAPVIPELWHEAIHMAAGKRACRLLGLLEGAGDLDAQLTNFIATHRTSAEESRRHGGPRTLLVGGRHW